MNKDYVVVIANVSWADEIDCEMFAVYPKGQWEDLVNETREAFKKVEAEGDQVSVTVGTNEDIEVSSFNEWFNEFKVKDITEDDAKVLRKLFGDSYSKRKGFTWGTGSGFIHIIERMSDE